MNHAATADGHAAAILRAGQPEVFAENPQQRFLRIRLDDQGLAIYSERNLPHQFASFVNLFRTSAADKLTVVNPRKVCFTITSFLFIVRNFDIQFTNKRPSVCVTRWWVGRDEADLTEMP